jgi:hypothetical protein
MFLQFLQFCFVDISAPAVRLHTNKILWEIVCVILVLAMIYYFIQTNSKDYKLQTIWPTTNFNCEKYDTGDILVAFQGFLKPPQENLFLNPGHVYLVVNSDRYGQKFLWDLTFWDSSQQFKNLTSTVTNLLKKKVPVYCIHLQQIDQKKRKMLTGKCLRNICKNTYNVTYDINTLLEHLGNGIEELAFLPSVCNPFVDIHVNKHYCSLYVFKLLVEFGVLDHRILADIPKMIEGNVVPAGGGIFYPYFLLHNTFSLNGYTNSEWRYAEPERIIQ